MGRIVGVMALALAGALACASSSLAAITASQITSPANPAFTTWNVNEPRPIEIAGTTSGGSPGDEVDILCVTGSQAEPLETGVPLAGNGSFFVAAADVAGLTGRLCRLHAVPAGTTPGDLAPFAGPVLAIGSRRLDAYQSGPSIYRAYGFFVNSQQLSAGSPFRSLGACGVAGAYLDNAALEQTTRTFDCAPRFWRFDDYDEPGDSTRSQIQVDGVDAYTAASINETWGGTASNFPGISFSASQDPATGAALVHDDESLVACPSLAYPATTAECFLGTGVRDERTIEQGEDGHLVTITDRYSSTDGASHSIDLLPENIQRFAGPLEEHGESIAYRFPGEATYATHVSGDVVDFGESAPAAILVKVEGAADGDQATGRGAIVFDRPASPATFNLLLPLLSGFQLHQAGTVPASGSTTFRTAYVQAYTSAEVEAIRAEAEADFAPPVTPPAPPVAPPEERVLPPATIKLVKVKLDRRHGTATVLAQVSGPGHLTLVGKRVFRKKAASQGAEIVKLAVRARGRAKARLDSRGRVKVRVRVAFAPNDERPAVSRARSIVLFKRR